MEEYNDLDPNDRYKDKLFYRHGVWYRYEGVEVKNKPKELREILYTCTHKLDKKNTNEENEKILNKFEYDMREEFEGIYREFSDHHTCICSYSRCGLLNYLLHKKTQQTFAVGSHCIKKFIDPLFTQKVNYVKTNGVCEICRIYKVLKTTQDFEKNCKSRENRACIRCKIPFMEKQVAQMRNLIEYREMVLEQNEKSELLDYENQTNMIALNIKYHEKDYYKERYGIVWNQDLKLWFINKCKIRHEKICDKIYLG